MKGGGGRQGAGGQMGIWSNRETGGRGPMGSPDAPAPLVNTPTHYSLLLHGSRSRKNRRNELQFVMIFILRPKTAMHPLNEVLHRSGADVPKSLRMRYSNRQNS